MRNKKVILVYLLILVGIASCATKKKSETFISQRDSISYALPSTNRILIENLCDTLEVRPGIVLSQNSGPVKVDVKTTKRGVEIVTQYDTIFKDRIKEVIVKENVEVVKQKIKWSAVLYALVIGFLIGLFRPWKYI